LDYAVIYKRADLATILPTEDSLLDNISQSSWENVLNVKDLITYEDKRITLNFSNEETAKKFDTGLLWLGCGLCRFFVPDVLSNHKVGCRNTGKNILFK